MSSTEQASLGEMLREAVEAKADRERQRALKLEAALYSKPTGDVSEVPRDPPTRTCKNCGSDVEAGLARVMGNNNGNIPACSDCTVNPHGMSYESDVAAARNAVAGIAILLEEGER